MSKVSVHITFLYLSLVLYTSCAPSTAAIQTAIAQTQTAQPQPTPISSSPTYTSTPIPPLPSATPTSTSATPKPTATYTAEPWIATSTRAAQNFRATLTAIPTSASPPRANYASVEVEVPGILSPGQNYSILLKEINGVGVVLNEEDYFLSCDRGLMHRMSPGLVESKWITIAPYGQGEEKTYVPSSWDDCWNLSGWYEGMDSNGNRVHVDYGFKILKTK